MSTWDGRSEEKLIQWMFGTEEGTLYFRDLLELSNIRDSLISYWAVHYCMDDSVDIKPEDLVENFNKEPEKWSLKFIIRELFLPIKQTLLI